MFVRVVHLETCRRRLNVITGSTRLLESARGGSLVAGRAVVSVHDQESGELGRLGKDSEYRCPPHYSEQSRTLAHAS